MFSKKDGFNWSLSGDPLAVAAAVQLKEPPKATSSGPNAKNDQFGPRNFDTPEEATDHPYVFLQNSSPQAAAQKA